MTEENIFSTRDLYLASTLVTLKFPIVGIDFQIEGEKNQPVGYFNFENTAELHDAESKYWSALLSVEPRSLINNMRGLKARVTNIYKGPRVDQSKFRKEEPTSKTKTEKK